MDNCSTCNVNPVGDHPGFPTLCKECWGKEVRLRAFKIFGLGKCHQCNMELPFHICAGCEIDSNEHKHFQCVDHPFVQFTAAR